MEDLDFIQVLARRSKQPFEQEHDMASSLGVRGSSESKTRTYALQPHRGCLCLGQPGDGACLEGAQQTRTRDMALWPTSSLWVRPCSRNHGLLSTGSRPRPTSPGVWSSPQTSTNVL